MFWKDTGIPVFIAALFTMTKIWKQHKCPLTDEWIGRCGMYIYPMEYYSAIKEQNNTICSNMDRARNYHTKWSKSDKGKYDFTYIWNLLKNDITELISNTEIDT